MISDIAMDNPGKVVGSNLEVEMKGNLRETR